MFRRKKSVIHPPGHDPRQRFKRDALRVTIHVLAWVGMAVIYYIGFSFLFDTPVEYEMKRSTARLRREYIALSQRYDSLEPVLNNVIERDRNVFNLLFEAEPYDFDGQYATDRWQAYEQLLTKSNRELGDEFAAKSRQFDKNLGRLRSAYARLQARVTAMGDSTEHIPGIQPVNNPGLTLLTASYGMRIHPFYKTLTAHQGVDYTVPEGTRVFATADGVVKEINTRSTTGGITVVLSHGNGYETAYSNLSRVGVTRGQRVRRGDIIAFSGNTGLSLAPHLHYEVRKDGMRVDPIHYFFLELDPARYRRMIRIAQSGMQSFD
ncbi:MAG: M23 family metallopeptidase [Rikenellaceae bacterium]|nr:M23 family metallopeptidase [Rikenellaceae bacterium]